MIARIQIPDPVNRDTDPDRIPTFLIPADPIRPWAFLASLFVHALIAATVSIATVMLHVGSLPDTPVKPHVTRVISLLPRLNSPPRPRPPAPAPVPQTLAQAQAAAAAAAAAGKLAATQAANAAAAAAAAATTARTEPQPVRTLPLVVKKPVETATREILIQPDLPKLATTKVSTPDMVLLNETINRQPKIIRPTELPKQARLPAQIKLIDEIPKLGQDPRALMAARKTPTILQTPPAIAKAPVAVPKSDAKPQPVATDAGAGKDTPTIISLPSQAVPLHEVTVLPPNRTAPADGVSDGTIRAGAATAGGGGTATAGGGTNPATAAIGAAAGKGNGKSDKVAGFEARLNGADGGFFSTPLPAVGSGGAPGGAGVSPAMPTLGTTGSVGTPLRIERPRTGNYDFAIINTDGAIPGSAGLIKGRPVYTVYVPMKGGKDWVLQFATLGNGPASTPRNGSVVTLDEPTPQIAAPYSFVMIRPGSKMIGDARYAFIHGLLNTAGRFEGLQQMGATRFIDGVEALHGLAQWEFRPATRDGVPISIEILLCVPNVSY